MFNNLGIFKMSAEMAYHAGRRQALSAENMAHVDTPGYKAKRLPSFSDAVEQRASFTELRATRPAHLNGSTETTTLASIREERDNPSPDGNTVSVEREMLASVGAKREHDRAIAIYRSALNILHSTLAR